MIEMKPLMKVAPSSEITPHRHACDKAFAFTYWYSGRRDLVEDIVAAKFWPLGKSRPSFRVEMVHLPVYSPTHGVPFPVFE